MSKPYAVLLQEIKTMQAHAEIVKQREIVGVIARIKEAIKAYSITMEELYAISDAPSRKANSHRARTDWNFGTRPKATPKYRDDKGNVWGGRGPRPTWLKNALANGKTLGDFEV